MAKKVDRWEEVLRHLGRDISKPVIFLTADEIKLATRELGTQEEPRLMASMDSERALPDFFRRNSAFLLPVSRGGYAIVHGRGFHELEPPARTEEFRSRIPIDLTTLGYGRGESGYLLHALHSGLISHFSRVGHLYPTVLGKMGTIEFDFHVNGSPGLRVDGAGMEVDLGLESETDVILLEAKVQPRSTFLVRQLYYPFRTFSQVSPKKRIRPMFFVAEPEVGAYTFWEYEWQDALDYETLRLKDSARFYLKGNPPPSELLREVGPDPSLMVVPQANTFRLVAELPALVDAGISTAREWASRQHYDVRQGNYYSQAAEGLGLIRRELSPATAGFRFALTEAGRSVLAAPAGRARDSILARLLLRNPVMNATFRRALEKSPDGVGEPELRAIIEANSGLTSATPKRRASTILSYFRWLAEATGAVRVDQERRIYAV